MPVYGALRPMSVSSNSDLTSRTLVVAFSSFSTTPRLSRPRQLGTGPGQGSHGEYTTCKYTVATPSSRRHIGGIVTSLFVEDDSRTDEEIDCGIKVVDIFSGLDYVEVLQSDLKLQGRSLTRPSSRFHFSIRLTLFLPSISTASIVSAVSSSCNHHRQHALVFGAKMR